MLFRSETSMSNPELIKNDEERPSILYLTNNNAFKMTNAYINKFNLVNDSFKVNLEKSYKFKATWYNQSETKIYRQYLKNLETDGTKLGKNEGQLVQLYDINSRLYCENTNDEYFIDKIDTDNVHKNYALAKVTNEFNLENLSKMKLIVTLNQINFSIKRFQNIKVEIYNNDDLLSKDANTKKPGFP